MLALPLSWPLEGRRVVLIGAGDWLARKLTLLRRTPASLSVYTPDGGTFDIETEARWPEVEDLHGATLVIVAFDDRSKAERGAALARAAHLPVNVVDFPDLGDFHIPAIIDRGSLSIGVATGGTAPVLARETRRKIEAAVPPSEAFLADFATRLSPSLREAFANVDDRRRVWEAVLDSPAARLAREGKVEAALELARKDIQNPQPRTGVVHLVGAGPGDPELLTLKALRLLSEADVIVYDRLVGDGIMDMARRDCERFYVGKARSNHSVPQDQIHALLVEQARLGKRVVRLKGGDPFVFGRGGEEVEALKAAGIEVHITPGITAALGCAASSGVPLTHRDHAQSVSFITGHAQAPAEKCEAVFGSEGATTKNDGEFDHNPLQLDWDRLAAKNHTLAVYMGVHTAQTISDKLTAHGRDPQTPVLVIENGTRPNEKCRLTRLSLLPDALRADPPQGPALLMIGEVASLYTPTAPELGISL
ncbi:siroheme synthase CysG [Asticcacaulis sp. YBE204]|uniref:siroheme synthase CysG n=1 Tax=Asticcacaulis sp. YBE204 TaxID=1282363 RepID=UPI0003C3FC1A|nr:siroheme synthase CysG [Asticcacaulis sp. YBE204]ESQ81153.1 uroporphyrin-III C-methyltransferase [Asticcacaulis sp. YBE204]